MQRSATHNLFDDTLINFYVPVKLANRLGHNTESQRIYIPALYKSPPDA